jgi:hypothetical protein
MEALRFIYDFIPALAGIFHNGMEIPTLYATFAADFKGLIAGN